MSFDFASAVSRRAVIEFEYDGERRTVEPYVYGLSTAGHYVLRGYQVRGGSLSGEATNWRLFLTSKIYGARETGAYFAAARPGYNPDDPGFIEVRGRVR